MGNLPREAKNTQEYWILFLRPHKEKISPKSRCTREEMTELQLPREALCSALTYLCSAHLRGEKAEENSLHVQHALHAIYARVLHFCTFFFPFLDNKLFRLVFHLYRRSNQFLSRGVSKPL